MAVLERSSQRLPRLRDIRHLEVSFRMLVK